MKNKEKYNLNELKYETRKNAWGIISVIKIIDKLTDEILYEKRYKDCGVYAYEAFQVFSEWLESKYVPSILDEQEKKYLSAVIKPFREDVKCIMKFKRYPVEKEFIRICMKDNYDNCTLPDFEKGTMYKGMERGKEYTLEELGL